MARSRTPDVIWGGPKWTISEVSEGPDHGSRTSDHDPRGQDMGYAGYVVNTAHLCVDMFRGYGRLECDRVHHEIPEGLETLRPRLMTMTPDRDTIDLEVWILNHDMRHGEPSSEACDKECAKPCTSPLLTYPEVRMVYIPSSVRWSLGTS